MIEMKFYRIGNMDKMSRMIQQSAGKILLRQSDNSLLDLKERGAKKKLQTAIQNGGAEMLFSSMEDYGKFLHFMIQGTA